MMTLAGKNLRLFQSAPGKSKRMSPQAPLYPAMRGMALWVFQLCGLSVVCGLCRASILAGLALMQGYASPLRSPGPSFPSAVIFRSFTRSDFAVSPSNSRQPCASGCGFPCALATLQARQRWRHGTARCRGICEQRRKTSCNMRNLSL